MKKTSPRVRRSPLAPLRLSAAGLLLLLSMWLAPARADEIDLNGSWQLEFDCLGSPTGSDFIDIVEDVGSGALDATTTSCGPQFFLNQVRAVTSCGTVPPTASTPGQVSGTDLLIPDAGAVRFRHTFASTFSFGGSCTSPMAQSIEADRMIDGVIAADRSIAGSRLLSNI